MVTPTDPDAHGAPANPRDGTDDGEARESARPIEPPRSGVPTAHEAAPPGVTPSSRSTDDAPPPDGESPGLPVGERVSSSVGESPGLPVGERVSSSVGESPGPPVGERVSSSVGESPGPPVGPPVLPAVPASTGEGPPRRRRTGRILLAIAVFLLTAFLVGAAFVPLPYYLFKPGSVRDTEPLIAVEGTEVFPSEGSIGYTTVSLRQATLLGLAQGWLDDDIDVIDRDRVLQGRDVDENREVNLQMMSDSKQVATQVALERLGYDIDVTVGQVVIEVIADTPADGVLDAGDVITAIDGEAFDDAQDLSRLLDDERPGDTITATVQPPSGEAPRDVGLALAAAPDDPDKGVMGVRVMNVVLDYDFPVDVQIDTGDVGGPSAGLAFTLALIDDLTPGDLTGGYDVAVTGTISDDGTVGPVGGTGQKAAAVREAGITLFLVPSADYQAAVDHAGDDLEVVAVDTIDEALAALGEWGGNVDELPPAGEAAAAPIG
jgi:PDZ domain-containing protein